MERYLLKNNAKEQIRGKWGIVILTFLIASVIGNGITALCNIEAFESATFIGVVVNLILGGLMEFGMSKFSLNIANSRSFEFTDIFDGFKEKVWLKSIGLYVVIGIITFAGYMLFVVPGVIVSLMFSQSFFILCEDENKSIRECLDESMNMMKFHKSELFVLYLSFLGWFLLMVVTCGIAALWINPYFKVTLTNYYLELKKGNQKRIDNI